MNENEMTNNTHDIYIQFSKEGRHSILEAFLPAGFCFVGGNHSFVVDWPHGKKSEMMPVLNEYIASNDIEPCDCEDCTDAK